jgi:hypothetical protein
MVQKFAVCHHSDHAHIYVQKVVFTSFPVMAVNKQPTFGVLFLGSISPSKMGHIAPFLATIQPYMGYYCMPAN